MAKQVALYKLPEVLETARILDDSVLGNYNDSIQSFNEIARQTLGKFDKRNGDLTGSNPFMLVHLANSGLLSSGARLAGRKEVYYATLSDVIERNLLPLKEQLEKEAKQQWEKQK